MSFGSTKTKTKQLKICWLPSFSTKTKQFIFVLVKLKQKKNEK